MEVAQVSQPAVSQCFQPASAADFRHRPVISTSCRLEIGDTAGWETCATARSGPANVELARRLQGFFRPDLTHLTFLTHSLSFLSFPPFFLRLFPFRHPPPPAPLPRP